jgi:flagellar hook-basal body complex protein FliE
MGGIGTGFDAVQATQSKADSLAVQAAAGTLTDPSQLTIAATQASLMTSLATTIESKAVQAFNQIMSMQA